MYEAGGPSVAHIPLTAVTPVAVAVVATSTHCAPPCGVAGSQAAEAAGAAPPTALIASSRVTVPGNATRPACPTSCCSSSVAPRMPLCISVRFQTVVWACVICRSALVTMLDTAMSTPIATISSMSEKPECGCVLVTRPLEPRRFQGDDGRPWNQCLSDRRLDGRGYGDLLDAGR